VKRYFLDTSALLTLRDDEDGAEVVASLLTQAMDGKVRCYGCFISQMEILYRIWKDENEQEARLAYQQCLALPVEWLHESAQLLEKAAEIKATHRMSLADAWIAAGALLENAVLVHKDPEFKALACAQIELPFK
jgi:predicted nucleic acid-binding protein